MIGARATVRLPVRQAKQNVNGGRVNNAGSLSCGQIILISQPPSLTEARCFVHPLIIGEDGGMWSLVEQAESER